MSGESFRFLHAGDFSLETPLGDLDAVAPSMRSDLIAAPRTAASAVFDAALSENVDFLVLSGNLLSPAAAGPHGMSLVIDGLSRLAEKNKPVFWTTGKSDDTAKWPDAVPLPKNVHLFSKSAAELVPVVRGGRTICTVTGRSADGNAAFSPAGYDVETTDHFSVAVGHGQVDASALSVTPFDHWCLGGRSQHMILELPGQDSADAANRTTAAYCGSPQSRSIQQTGPHGYLVVDVDADRTRRVHHVATDVFRYVDHPVDAATIASAGSLKNLLGSTIAKLQSDGGGRHLIVRFDVRIARADDMSLVGDIDTVLDDLRRDHGGGNPGTWVASIDVSGPAEFPKSWRDEDTILGDFLRATTSLETSGGLDLSPLTEEQTIPETLASRLVRSEPARLRDATLMGVRMLRGEAV